MILVGNLYVFYRTKPYIKITSTNDSVYESREKYIYLKMFYLDTYWKQTRPSYCSHLREIPSLIQYFTVKSESLLIMEAAIL